MFCREPLQCFSTTACAWFCWDSESALLLEGNKYTVHEQTTNPRQTLQVVLACNFLNVRTEIWRQAIQAGDLDLIQFCTAASTERGVNVVLPGLNENTNAHGGLALASSSFSSVVVVDVVEYRCHSIFHKGPCSGRHHDPSSISF